MTTAQHDALVRIQQYSGPGLVSALSSLYSGRREREAVYGRVTPLFRRCQKSAQWPTGGPPGARLGPDSGREEAEEEASAPDDRELGDAGRRGWGANDKESVCKSLRMIGRELSRRRAELRIGIGYWVGQAIGSRTPL